MTKTTAAARAALRVRAPVGRREVTQARGRAAPRAWGRAAPRAWEPAGRRAREPAVPPAGMRAQWAAWPEPAWGAVAALVEPPAAAMPPAASPTWPSNARPW